MVRGPAALLGASLLALAYFLVAGALPDLGDGDLAVLLPGGIGLVLVAVCVLALVSLGDAIAPLVLLVCGAGLLVAALDVAGVGAGASMPEALLAGSLGALLGRLLAAPVVALAVPLFVALVDAWSVATGPTSRLLHDHPHGADALSFELPSWGQDGGSRLGLADAIFLAMFAAWAARFGLRPRATAVGMVAGLLATLAISVLTDRALPALPLIAVGYWLPNLDRLAGLLRRERA